ncbi:MAG: GGDEF domain-containing protein, partial [Thermomicrobiaceae bacterium]|nr:GGDEF domain-containing protein [Thermomicrobiaceae bacterium]
PTPPLDFRIRHRSGAWRYLEVTSNNLLDVESVRGIVFTARDVTVRRELQERLMRQAFYDALTGLPNRSLFLDRLATALAQRDRRHELLAVMFIDLDGFKAINDRLGHAAGDELLRGVGQRLELSVRSGDTVSRYGGDEFTVLLTGLTDPGAVHPVARRILAGIHEPFQVGSREVSISASIGVAIGGSPEPRPDDLLRDADIALYRAKALGKRRYVVFDPRLPAPESDC